MQILQRLTEHLSVGPSGPFFIKNTIQSAVFMLQLMKIVLNKVLAVNHNQIFNSFITEVVFI